MFVLAPYFSRVLPTFLFMYIVIFLDRKSSKFEFSILNEYGYIVLLNK